ncbi:hypothetical protein DFH06DRAFT_1329617 [Mycena polygramma]|nr:hypothetical protein DFH06DRAFT_1329617 [Mycena polygramma]
MSEPSVSIVLHQAWFSKATISITQTSNMHLAGSDSTTHALTPQTQTAATNAAPASAVTSLPAIRRLANLIRRAVGVLRARIRRAT